MNTIRQATLFRRQLDWRPAPSTLIIVRVDYKVNRLRRMSVDILNVLDSRVSDVDFYYASKLAVEPAPVNNIQTHPAEPRTLRLSLRTTSCSSMTVNPLALRIYYNQIFKHNH